MTFFLVEYGGRYKAMFSHKIKNYALLDYDGKLTMKGSGPRSRGLAHGPEPMQALRNPSKVNGISCTYNGQSNTAISSRYHT